MGLVELDRAHLIHPFTEFRVHEERGAIIVTGGEGIRIRSEDGRTFIDGLSGLWNIVVGHGRTEIGEAVAKQMKQLASYPGVWDYATEPAVTLAGRMARLLPADRQIERFMFTTGGSEANEMCFRFALMYHAVRGEPERRKVLARRNSYHGITSGAVSATRIDVYHRSYKPPDPSFIEVPAAYRFRCGYCEGESACTLRCADSIEEAIEREGPETIAALIAEPVMATGGVIPPAEGYFPRLREICDRHGILLILDEIVTGFGRTGNWFGMQTVAAHPDLMSFAKGITSGYLPLGGVGVSKRVYETIRDQGPRGLPFMGAVTNGNHATCCAAAHANLDIIEREGLVENAAIVGAYLQQALADAFADQPYAGDLRGVGMMAALEWAKPGTREPAGAQPTAFAAEVSRQARQRGLLVRAGGENTLLAPPLCTTREEVDEVVGILSESAVATVASL